MKRVPRANTYYELSEENLSFTFPEPGLLDGVKSKGKAIIKMDKCTFTYETKKDPTVIDITLQASLNSRMAVIGPKRRGKVHAHQDVLRREQAPGERRVQEKQAAAPARVQRAHA